MAIRMYFIFTILIILLAPTCHTNSLLADVKQNPNVIGYGLINSSYTYLRELPTPENPKGEAIGMIPKWTAVKIIKTTNISGNYLYFIKYFHKNREYSGWIQVADIDLRPEVEKQYNNYERQYEFQNKLDKIRMGMLENEVLNIIGNPVFVSKFNKQNYVYHYNSLNGQIPISFENDRVASIGTDLRKNWEVNKEIDKEKSKKSQKQAKKLNDRKRYDFRKARWGMTQKEIIKSESEKPECVNCDEEGTLGYRASLLGKDVFLWYFFIQNKLGRATYMLMEEHTNKNDFIEEYQDFKKALTKKYGKSIIDKVVWTNDLFKNEPSRWGLAVSIGHLKYISTWDTESTTISCILRGDNYNISCGIIYRSKKLKYLMDNKREKKALDDL